MKLRGIPSTYQLPLLSTGTYIYITDHNRHIRVFACVRTHMNQATHGNRYYNQRIKAGSHQVCWLQFFVTGVHHVTGYIPGQKSADTQNLKIANDKVRTERKEYTRGTGEEGREKPCNSATSCLFCSPPSVPLPFPLQRRRAILRQCTTARAKSRGWSRTARVSGYVVTCTYRGGYSTTATRCQVVTAAPCVLICLPPKWR